MELVRKHTERFTKQKLHELLNTQATPCISIYMPTHKIGNEAEQDPIRLKNLLSAAEEELSSQNIDGLDISSLLAPAQALIDDREFWQYQSHGLAIFCAPEYFELYRLPIKFDELSVVSSHFHTKPLLPLLSGNGLFYLLALSQNSATLFSGTRFRIGEVQLGEDVPTSLDEAMRFDEFESQLQSHTRNSAQGTSNGAMHFGMSDAGDESLIKENIKRFLNSLDKGVVQHLADEKEPLILAGVDYMCGLYRGVSQYDNILDEIIEGNPEQASPEDLHTQAWKLIEPHFEEAQGESMQQYLQLKGTGDEKSSTDLDEIVSGAYFQRVDTLFVPVGVQKWGTFDSDKNQVTLHEEKESDDHDLYDFAAIHTIVNGGTVYAVEPDKIPGSSETAAILRY